MAHMRKCTMSEAVHLCKHYERNSSITHYGNSDVDMERSGENYNLAPDRESQTGYINEMLAGIDHAKRKDLVVMADLIITEPADLPQEYRTEFFQEAYNFCKERYCAELGEKAIISSYVHLDETTPHMHFAFLPIVNGKNKGLRFCAKEKICRADLKTLHKDMQTWFDERNIPARVQNGNTRFNKDGQAISVKELKRDSQGHHNRWNVSLAHKQKIENHQGRW